MNNQNSIIYNPVDNPVVLPIFKKWLKNLRHLNSLPLNNFIWDEGICRSCLSDADFIDSLINFRNNLLKSWPKFSGDLTFPIEGGTSAYIEHTTDYKQLRKELSLHCIAELEKLLIPQYSFGNFPLEHRIKILKTLKKLYRLPATNEAWGTGLCFHLTGIEKMPLILSMNYLEQHFKIWKYYSGIEHSPIPWAEKINKTKSRKQLRKNLCGHVIKSIEAELKYVL